MPDVCHIRCPECDEKFKSTKDKEGKKIRCPECDAPFKVTAAMMSQPKEKSSAIQKEAKPVPQAEEKPAAPKASPAAAGVDDPDLDEDGNPYGMIQVEVAPRCPSCAKELKNAKDVICVYCGYNLLTREVGETKKVYELSPQEHLLHLAPALGALAFAFVWVLVILGYCLILPRFVADTWMSWLDSEPMRLFFTVPNLGLVYWAGSYGLNYVIFKPKPQEREK